MTRKIVLACKTHLQLISSLCIIDDYLTKGEVVEACFMSLSDRFSSTFIDRLNKLGLFNFAIQLPIFASNTYLEQFGNKMSVKDMAIFYSTRFASKPKLLRRIRSFAIKNFFLEKSHRDFISSASDLFIYDPYDISFVALSLMNKSCIIHQMDEGIGAYLGYTTSKLNPDEIHLYEPKLSQHDQIQKRKIRKIPKISLTNDRLIKWLKSLYPHAINLVFPEKIFFDQVYGEVKGSQERDFRLEVIKSLFSEDPTVYYRPHPAANQDFFKRNILPHVGSRLYPSKENTPFEIELLLSSSSPACLYSINSSSTTHWKLMLDVPLNLKIILYEQAFRASTNLHYQKGTGEFFKMFLKEFRHNTTMISKL